MPVTASGIPDQPLIPANGMLFYGLAVHPDDGTLFVTDAIDYVQNGKAYQFSSSTGEQMNSWPVGRIPGSFCFGEETSSRKNQ
jgi:hypothetical protein